MDTLFNILTKGRNLEWLWISLGGSSLASVFAAVLNWLKNDVVINPLLLFIALVSIVNTIQIHTSTKTENKHISNKDDLIGGEELSQARSLLRQHVILLSHLFHFICRKVFFSSPREPVRPLVDWSAKLGSSNARKIEETAATLLYRLDPDNPPARLTISKDLVIICNLIKANIELIGIFENSMSLDDAVIKEIRHLENSWKKWQQELDRIRSLPKWYDLDRELSRVGEAS